MAYFIDRRLNPKGKSLANRQRFLRRARAQIREAVQKKTSSMLGGMLGISPLTSIFKIICVVLAFFTVLLASGERLRNQSEYLALILLATVGLMLLVGSEELLMIFIGLELTGLSLYVLTAFDKSDIRSAEAGLKYFLFGSTASAFTLFGLSFIYGLAGTTAGNSKQQGSSDAQCFGQDIHFILSLWLRAYRTKVVRVFSQK